LLIGIIEFRLFDIPAILFAAKEAKRDGTAIWASTFIPDITLGPTCPRLFPKAAMFFSLTGFTALRYCDIL
jgi:hypothetical protein